MRSQLLKHHMIKTIEEALEKQRSNVDFNHELLSQFLYGRQEHLFMKNQLEKKQVFPFDPNMFNRGRLAVIKQTVQNAHLAYNNVDNFFNSDIDLLYALLNVPNQLPGSIHVTMFIKALKIMGSSQQIAEFMERAQKFDIVGCYAQTEIAHGSDVSSLLTVATFDESTDQFIVDTPNIKSIKFWPGDLGLFATHALVYANLVIKGKNHGIQAFIVPIRDVKTMKPLQNVQVGDVGPKIGFPAKDNGYLILKKVRIPRRHMLSKFTQVTRNGQITTQGNPKVGYAAMMQIRKQICVHAPKIYTSAIKIAAYYSMFRRQFKNSGNEEIKILDYQLQQDKITSRVAEYYAVTLAGNQINQLCVENLKRVLEKNDFSLMGETHICLSLGKPLISQIVYDGMEICRKACGGHGYSTYSGFSFLIQQYGVNLTYEGQNTILYLQVARYLLKCLQNSMDPNKQLSKNVSYLKKYNELRERKCTIDEPSKWTIKQIQTLITQSVCYLLSVVTEKMLSDSQSSSPKDIWNKKAGIKLKQLGIAHSIYYIYSSFAKKVAIESNSRIKQITSDLCLLFGINMLMNFSQPLIESANITSEQLVSLMSLKEQILKKLRPIIIGLIDGFGIPDKYVRSTLVRGNPYQNMLKLARENEMNHQKLQAVNVVKEVRKYIINPDPTL